jgi:hypothetical protein
MLTVNTHYGSTSRRIGHLQLLYANNYDNLADLHTSIPKINATAAQKIFFFPYRYFVLADVPLYVGALFYNRQSVRQSILVLSLTSGARLSETCGILPLGRGVPV